mmetsp:Transcript_34828/g.54444  ORF Transcript_34828/g.54444 Transcript_34828/m.54444 type:complete len:88 (+) Transcript_34828:1394-1657(+)
MFAPAEGFVEIVMSPGIVGVVSQKACRCLRSQPFGQDWQNKGESSRCVKVLQGVRMVTALESTQEFGQVLKKRSRKQKGGSEAIQNL